MPVPIASQKAQEKEIKRAFKLKAQAEPEKYYPVSVLAAEGFQRKKCAKCGTFFWSTDSERKVCGEPDCSGGYTFIGNTPAKAKMDYIETWKKFSSVFKKFGYTPIKRYPVAARWRDDTDFVQASIYDFQPYVVSGEVDPPANPLVVPQFCLRFNDIDNVGVTGRHYSGFVMIGQQAFMKPKDYSRQDYLRHIYTWLTEGVRIPKEHLQFHEDAWAGGGNMGPSIEFFSGGLELGNQVYMQYDVKSGAVKELNIKVLDMGTGQERYSWFTNGASTSYETVFPTVSEKLYKMTGIKPDKEIFKKFLPMSGLLNIDEVADIEKTWNEIAKKIGIDSKQLKEHIMPLAGIYSIGDHTRSLLVALSDGVLPSNVGGGYNLRVLLRRSLDISANYGWNIDLNDVCEWHAKYLKPQYPELIENLEEVKKIIEVEKRKYKETSAKSRKIVSGLSEKDATEDRLISLYDSNGISPEMLKSSGLKIKIPDDFYKKVAERHEKVAAKAETKKAITLDLAGVPETEILYFDNYLLTKFEAKVLKVIEGKYVILDKTAFYPTSGGQMHDNGKINGSEIIDVFKQGNVIIHQIKPFGASIREGDKVKCEIDLARRVQLTQHHSAAHIINGAARKILGNHIWQAGAEKTLEKGRLDITHYDSLSSEEIKKIESLANKIVKDALPVESMILPRADAEKAFGFRLYQGGAVPGKKLRVIKINNIDVEACGGTHLKNTKESGEIKIIGASKIQDGVVRIEFAAGAAAKKFEESARKEIRELGEFFAEMAPTLKLKISENDIERIAQIFSVPKEKVRQTLVKFRDEYTSQKSKIKELQEALSAENIKQEAVRKYKDTKDFIKSLKTVNAEEFSRELFARWKEERKDIEILTQKIAELKAKAIKSGDVKLVDFDAGTMRNIAAKLDKVLLINREGIFVFRGSDEEFAKLMALGAKGGGAQIKQGRIDVRQFEKLKGIFNGK
ncbi:Alanine--tRNA ligase [uncultured archaeon]|nr:Alanine--tRNA ligase [uncultured archaeon]